MPDRPVALVTGASSGIGLTFARQLAARGHDLVVVARTESRLKDLAAQLPVEVEVLPADLTDPDQLGAVERRLGDATRPVDLLVNNAGFGFTGTFVDVAVDRHDAEIRLNALALTRLLHAALEPMVARRRGAVINVASVAGFQPAPRMAVYSATKAYVLSLSEAVHEEVRRSGVKVMALCPGYTPTEFQARAGYESSSVPGPAWTSAEQVVRTALADLERGRAVSVPGVLYKVVTGGGRLLPRAAVRRAAALVTRHA